MPWAAITLDSLKLDFGVFYVPPFITIVIILTGVATLGPPLLSVFRLFLRQPPTRFSGQTARFSGPPPIPPSRSCRQFDVRNQELPPDERRSSLRRMGNAVDVLVIEADGASFEGLVIDRSTGGLCLSLPRSIPADTVLKVFACHAPKETPWLAVRVRHCRHAGDRWLCGCQFVESPPWGQLLLFG
jgi:hypothetical protein